MLRAPLLCLVPLLIAAAGNSGEPDAELRIGRVPTFVSEAEAKAACRGDAVVCADRYAGIFYFPREDQFGRTAQGAYACLHAAMEANYWDTGPFVSMARGYGPGREFPFTPTSPPFVGS